MVALAAVLLWATQASASTWTREVDGVRYQIDNDKNQAVIMGLTSANHEATELVFTKSYVAGGDSYDYYVTGVNIQAFYNSKLKKVDMSKLTHLTTFDHNCFANSSDLEEVILPEGLKNLGVSTFKGCSSLKEITLPSTLLSIGSYDFEGTALTELTIPASVNYVGKNIFAFWDSLLRINMENATPPTEFDKDAFSESLRRRAVVLYVPNGAVGDYKASDWWYSRFGDNIKSDNLGDVFDYGHLRYEMNEEAGTRYLEIVGVAEVDSPEWDWMLDLDGVQYDGRVYPVWYIVSESLKDYPWEELDLSRNMYKDLRTIGRAAFSGNQNLKRIKMGKNITWISDQAFYYCSNLEEVALPEKLEKIGTEAFKRCISLKHIEFCPDLQVISERAFEACWDLKGVKLPPYLLEVGFRAFYETGIEWIVIPETAKMHNESLLACNKLKYIFPMYDDPSVTTPAKNIFFMSSSPGTCEGIVIVPSDKVNVYKSSDWGEVFSDIRDTTVGLTLDNDTITLRLEDNMYWEISGGDLNFYPAIGEATITGISPNCVSADIEIHGVNEASLKGINFFGPFPVIPTKVAGRAFKNNTWLKSIDLSDMWKMDVGYQAFSGCTNLRSIGEGALLTDVGEDAFRGTALEEFHYFQETKNIGNHAFSGCSKLKKVIYEELGAGNVAIGNGAFEDCKALEWLEIGSEVKSIGFDAFANCTGLKRVTTRIGYPFPIDETVFYGITKESVPLYVPAGTIDTYKNTAGWREFFGNNITDGNVFRTVDDGTFKYEIYAYGMNYDGDAAQIKGLSNAFTGKKAVLSKPAVTIDGKGYPVDCIFEAAFEGTGVEEMDFTAATKAMTMGPSAFKNTKSLKRVSFNNKAGWDCSSHAFEGSAIEEITLAGDVEEKAFAQCDKLKTVKFAAPCYYIGDYAFSGCTSIEAITLPRNSEPKQWSDGYYARTELEIGDYAFNGSSIKSLTIPNYSNFYIGSKAFEGSLLMKVVSYMDWPTPLDANAFTGIPTDATLSIPAYCQSYYEYQQGWDHFYGHIEERPDVPTDIDAADIERDAIPSPQIFDLQGRRMADNPATLKKGIYIIGGKKVMVK